MTPMHRINRALIVIHCLGLPLYSLAAAADPAERIISIGGDVTEILYAIGMDERIIAVDTTSRYPARTKGLPNVGYMRRLSAEPILALTPDHIIAIADAGPKDVIAILQQAGVQFTEIPDTPTIEGALTKVRAVAAAVGRVEPGAVLAASITERINAALASVPKDRAKPRALFLLSVGRGALMAGGLGSSADAMIKLAGGENIATGFNGYKPFEPEAMLAINPEIIIVTKRTLAALGGVEQMRTQPQFAPTRAAETSRIVAFDGAMLLGFGARLASAIEMLTEAFYPASDQALSKPE
jgi:iron complex transport system substrate-binding protein